MSVQVTAIPNSNEILRTTKNPEIFQVRVEETRISYENGFRTSNKRSALISGPKEELSAEFFNGQIIPGQIIVMESLTPFRKEDIEKDIKIAGKTNIPCMVGDQPIFRTTLFTANMEVTDSLIAHTNTESIKIEIARLKETGAILVDEIELSSADLLAA